MSRRAIISDIHSNLVALEAVLADIQQQSVEGVVCLGDVCGYGPQPIECVERIRATVLWSLMGNHDEALFVQPRDFGKNARLAVEWQKRVLEPKLDASLEDEERWYWLQQLQPSRVEKDVLFVHASPREPLYEYVLREDFLDDGTGPSEKAKEMFAAMQWLCFCGHSHRPGVVGQDFHWYKPEELADYTHVLKPGYKTLINVGSVGQPRDAITDACYCIFDLVEPGDLVKTAKLKPLREGPPPVGPDDPTLRMSGTQVNVLARQGLSEVGMVTIGNDDKTPPSAELTKTARMVPAAQAAEQVGPQDDTRTSAELQKARETLMMTVPHVTFRRVPYNVAEAQARFRAVKELPENNALRLARGL